MRLCVPSLSWHIDRFSFETKMAHETVFGFRPHQARRRLRWWLVVGVIRHVAAQLPDARRSCKETQYLFRERFEFIFVRARVSRACLGKSSSLTVRKVKKGCGFLFSFVCLPGGAAAICARAVRACVRFSTRLSFLCDNRKHTSVF